MKAIILTTHTGGGHDAAASAVAEALTEAGVTCKVMDCVAFGGEWFSKAVSRTYVRAVQRSPEGFGRVYRLGAMLSTPKWKSPVYLVNSTYTRKMAKAIADYGADMVVCTHMFGGQSMTHLKRHGAFHGLLAMVMTDYTLSPFMEDIQADVLFVSHRGVMPQCLEKHIPEETMVPLGIPVSLKCRPCEDKRAAKEAAGLDPDRKIVLLAGGSMGAGSLPETITAVLAGMEQEDRLMVVCGSNEEVRAQCEAQCQGNPQVTVLGKVTPLYPLLAAADLVATKSGGLTSTETMTIGVPMLVVNPISGCETANADFFAARGMAAYAHSNEDITELTRMLLTNDMAREAMVAAQHREIDPDCARKIAACLIEKTAAMAKA
jgi:processive 1,2-diacylglycerol beta-glucosyltransferase